MFVKCSVPLSNKVQIKKDDRIQIYHSDTLRTKSLVKYCKVLMSIKKTVVKALILFSVIIYNILG